jgi:hypothetical protein
MEASGLSTRVYDKRERRGLFPSQLAVLRGYSILLRRIKLFYPSGKSILIFVNRVKPRKQKYFASHFCKSEL